MSGFKWDFIEVEVNGKPFYYTNCTLREAMNEALRVAPKKAITGATTSKNFISSLVSDETLESLKREL